MQPVFAPYMPRVQTAPPEKPFAHIHAWIRLCRERFYRGTEQHQPEPRHRHVPWQERHGAHVRQQEGGRCPRLAGTASDLRSLRIDRRVPLLRGTAIALPGLSPTSPACPATSAHAVVAGQPATQRSFAPTWVFLFAVYWVYGTNLFLL